MISNDEFIIIKVLKDNKEIINRISESKNKSIERYYNVVSNEDQENIKHLELLRVLNIVFVLFENKNDRHEPYEIYVGKGCFIENPKDTLKYNLKYKIEYGTSSKLIIDNFVLSAGIDLKNDFDDYCYIITETSITLYRKLLDSLSEYDMDILFGYNKEYPPHANDPTGRLSQNNSHCVRAFNTNDGASTDPRAEFQRDRERILHSKAFRRLVDKAQIFTSKKGDHFRTRMTHTLEVVQGLQGN